MAIFSSQSFEIPSRAGAMEKTDVQHCDACGKVDVHLLCGRCKARHYCSRSCQQIDWRNVHSFVCSSISTEKEIRAIDTAIANAIFEGWQFSADGNLKRVLDAANSLRTVSLDKALRHYKDACDDCIEQNDLFAAARFYLCIATTHYQMNQIVQAKKNAQLAKLNYEKYCAHDKSDAAHKAFGSVLAFIYAEIIAEYYQNKIRVTWESKLNKVEDAADGFKLTFQKNVDEIKEEKRMYSRFLYANDLCALCKQKNTPVKVCAGCRSAKYCSKTCQKQHWKEHKHHCRLDDTPEINIMQQANCTHILWKDRFQNFVTDCEAEFEKISIVETKKL